MTTPYFVVGTGPSELHALIDLEGRAKLRTPGEANPHVHVLHTAEHDGQWSAVGELRQPEEL